MSAKSEAYLLKQENRVKNPKPQTISLTLLVGAEALRGGVAGGVRCTARCRQRAPWAARERRASRTVSASAAAPAATPEGEFILAVLATHLAWPKKVTLCQSPCTRQLREAALLCQLQLKIQSETGRLLSGVSLATKLSQLLRAADYEQAASFPALSSHPCLPLASQSHYRTRLLLHVESW